MSSSVPPNSDVNKTQPIAPASFLSQVKSVLGNRKVQLIAAGSLLLVGAALTLGLGLRDGGVGALSDLSTNALLGIAGSVALIGAVIVGRGLIKQSEDAKSLQNRTSDDFDMQAILEDLPGLNGLDSALQAQKKLDEQRSASEAAIAEADAAVQATEAREASDAAQAKKDEAAVLAAKEKEALDAAQAKKDEAAVLAAKEKEALDAAQAKKDEAGVLANKANTQLSLSELESGFDVPELSADETEAVDNLFNEVSSTPEKPAPAVSEQRSWKRTALYVTLGLAGVGLGIAAYKFGLPSFGNSQKPEPMSPLENPNNGTSTSPNPFFRSGKPLVLNTSKISPLGANPNANRGASFITSPAAVKAPAQAASTPIFERPHFVGGTPVTPPPPKVKPVESELFTLPKAKAAPKLFQGRPIDDFFKTQPIQANV